MHEKLVRLIYSTLSIILNPNYLIEVSISPKRLAFFIHLTTVLYNLSIRKTNNIAEKIHFITKVCRK